ncbi:hypothetical protein OG234_13550 [Streptomyces sp. NBC_01420]|uniref:hypothetical protein n=1 Tax=Streptomyces sp. NBC_01420 TaxID=2903858 RepID=UPI00324D3EEE
MPDAATLTETDARALTDRIRTAVEDVWSLIKEAYTSRAWSALGYPAWDAYVEAEFRTAHLALPKEDRAQTVQSLREAGMSVRAISAATGVSVGTVHGDLARCSDLNTTAVTGTDGKSYAPTRPEARPSDDVLLAGGEWTEPDASGGLEDAPAPAPAPVPVPRPKERRPLPEVFAGAAHDLTRAADRLARVTEDDGFPGSREAVQEQLPGLLDALGTTTRALKAMQLGEAPASEEARRWWASTLTQLSDVMRDVASDLTRTPAPVGVPA